MRRIGYFFGGTFVLVYGDVITDFNLRPMFEFHREKGALATLAVMRASNPTEVGVVQVSEDSRIMGLVEKPPKGTEAGNLSSGGIYVMEREVLDYIPKKGFCDFAYDIFPSLIEAGLPVYGYILDSHDYLIDIGTPEKYCRAEKDNKAGSQELLLGKRAIFLDRDDIIISDARYCH